MASSGGTEFFRICSAHSEAASVDNASELAETEDSFQLGDDAQAYRKRERETEKEREKEKKKKEQKERAGKSVSLYMNQPTSRSPAPEAAPML